MAEPRNVPARLDLVEEGGIRILRLAARLDGSAAEQLWRPALAEASSRGDLVVDASEVEYCDGAGASLLLALRQRHEQAGGSYALRGLRDEFQELVALIEPRAAAVVESPAREDSFLVSLGRSTLELAADVRRLLVFTGELTVMLGGALRRPRSLRGRDVVMTAERAGIGALPIIGLVGFLLGLILAFQSAIPMQRFGAQIFVADLLAISLLRELGPLMAAILLTARSGSAFAAELGTMKVNEEIDALTTMGLEPLRFLVVPRVLASIGVVPVLTMATSLAGLLGGAVVFLSLDFPLVTYVNRIVGAVSLSDFASGIFKGFVFGVVVAAVGCMRGIQTGKGASAVGLSTTSSVVSGIILIAVLDGIFAVMFFLMGI